VKDFLTMSKRWPVRRSVFVVGLLLTGAAAGVSPSVASGSTPHCPVLGRANEGFELVHHSGKHGLEGGASPAKAFAYYLHTDGKRMHVPLKEWSHLSKDLFVHGAIRVNTVPFGDGSYAVSQVLPCSPT
jgi:hypothetical protein